MQPAVSIKAKTKNPVDWQSVKRQIYKGRHIYIMLLPVIIYFILFCYLPMYGVVIAFMDYKPLKGVFNSPWVGFTHFQNFFNSYYLWELIRNTLLINIYGIIFGFPAPIILALLLNEIRNKYFKRTVQTLTYLPHFVSMVVVVGIIINLLSTNGLLNNIMSYLGFERRQFMMQPDLFRTIYVASGIWQGVGWGSIIYLAALSGIDPQLYEASIVDGAGRMKQVIHITLPGIAPTIIILLILTLGNIMSVGFEKILLMQNDLNLSVSEVIQTFVYKRALIYNDIGYGTAVGLFNSVINFVLLVVVNRISRKLSKTSLW